MIISNELGNDITFDATVRALVPPVLEAQTGPLPGAIRLRLQDSDSGLPYDSSRVQVLWRADLSAAGDTNWQPLAAELVITNGYVIIDDTNAIGAPSRFYRAVEY